MHEKITEYKKEDPASVQEMFNNIAYNYDKTNAILSLNLHKRWNRILIRSSLEVVKPKVMLDLCCGTGAIAFEYLRKCKDPVKVYLLDFSEKMLEGAQAQAKLNGLAKHDLNFLQADAQNIPLIEKSVDCITIAYGIRNVQDPARCFKDAFRVLRPRGTIGILELTEPDNILMQLGHKVYLKTVVPLIGRLFTSNRKAYQYLPDSIRRFISPSEVSEMLKNAGFSNIKVRSLSCGIATLFTANK